MTPIVSYLDRVPTVVTRLLIAAALVTSLAAPPVVTVYSAIATPSNALHNEAGVPLLNENGGYILVAIETSVLDENEEPLYDEYGGYVWAVAEGSVRDENLEPVYDQSGSFVEKG